MAIQKPMVDDCMDREARPLLHPPAAAPTTHHVKRQATAASRKTNSSGRWGTSALHAGVLACIGAYAFGQVMYLSPFMQETVATAACSWLGTTVWRDARGVLNFDGGHWELLRPMFFVIWCVVPLLVSLVLFELARDHAHRRTASQLMLAVGAFMRRKPRVLGRLSPIGNGELLFHVALVGGNVALFWYGWIYNLQFLPRAGEQFTFDTVLEMLGILLGYNCVFSMAFLFLPCTRNCAWMDFLDISYANGVKYHRWLGVWTLATGVGHAVPFYWLWKRQGVLWAKSMPCFDCKLDYLSPGYSAWFNVFGEISLFFLLIVGVTSIPWVRRKMFETFYYTHHLYLLGVFFAVMHWVTIIWWLLPTVVLYFISRSASTWNAMHPVRVLEFTALPDDIIKIVLARTADADGAFEIGQFVYLNVPAISKLQWHAFTIASSPRASPTTFTILLKSLGDWTQDLVALAESSGSHAASNSSEHSGEENKTLPVMLVDGYYGGSLQSYENFSTVCLIGGGIGATPLFAILEDMVAKLAAGEVLKQRVHFVFSFRELSLLEEIHPVLAKLREWDPRGDKFSCRFFLTRRPSEAMLTQHIDYSRFTIASQQQLKTLATKLSMSAAHPFAEPLRSRTSRIAVYVLLLSLNTFVVLWLEFGGGKLMQTGTQWWPLQNFVEASTLFIFPVLVFAVLAIEKMYKLRGVGGEVLDQSLVGAHGAEIQGYSSIQHGAANHHLHHHCTSSDVLVAGDLIGEYGVTMGKRPNMKQILTQVHSEFERRGSDLRSLREFSEGNRIGIFISGPEALKSATEYAVADLGSHTFDIHEEEFEL